MIFCCCDPSQKSRIYARIYAAHKFYSPNTCARKISLLQTLVLRWNGFQQIAIRWCYHVKAFRVRTKYITGKRSPSCVCVCVCVCVCMILCFDKYKIIPDSVYTICML